MDEKDLNVNLNLYAPWGAFAIEPKEEHPFYGIPESLIPIAEARLVVAAQMYGETLSNAQTGHTGRRKSCF